jgi:hypothetical protein
MTGKEIVTAFLGVLVVGVTLYLVIQGFAFVGDQTKMSDTRDLLALMFGISGVVLGYYFGRIPADARAAQAHQQTQEATAKMERMGATRLEMAKKLESVAGSAVHEAAPANGGQSLAPTAVRMAPESYQAVMDVARQLREEEN